MTTNNQWIFIVNPISGGGDGRRIIPELEKQLAGRSLQWEMVLTEKHGHATRIAESYLEKGYTRFIAVGGDGTMNEVAEPLVGNKNVAIGLIPAGTGNDFVQILGFPDRFSDEHWEIFFQAQIIGMDTGLVNGRHFLNGMGLGFDAQVAAENYVDPDTVAKGSGKGKYVWHILKTLLFYRECRVTIRSGEEDQETSCFMNTIANGRRFAGSFYLTPQAMANDGLLDVCMIRKLNLLQRLKILTMVPKGSHTGDSKVHYYQTPTLTVDFGREVPYHLDGELYFDSLFEVKVVPSSVNIIFNPKGNHFFNLKT